MTRVYRPCGFTILELMVVISVIGVLLSMFFAIRPDPSIYVTQSRMQRVMMAVETYHESFYVYPHSISNGYTNSLNVLQGPYTLPEMLMRKDLRRRDGKHLDPFFDPEDDTEIENVAGVPRYFLDGWNRRLVYYSGAQLRNAMDLSHANSLQMIPAWLKISGKIDANTVVASVAGRYRAEDYFFLGSAGKDGVFGWNVCTLTSAKPGGPEDTGDYTGAEYSILTDLPPPQTPAMMEDGFDDMWNHNLGQQ